MIRRVITITIPRHQRRQAMTCNQILIMSSMTPRRAFLLLRRLKRVLKGPRDRRVWDEHATDWGPVSCGKHTDPQPDHRRDPSGTPQPVDKRRPSQYHPSKLITKQFSSHWSARTLHQPNSTTDMPAFPSESYTSMSRTHRLGPPHRHWQSHPSTMALYEA